MTRALEIGLLFGFGVPFVLLVLSPRSWRPELLACWERVYGSRVANVLARLHGWSERV